jgi:hypothetical protein
MSPGADGSQGSRRFASSTAGGNVVAGRAPARPAHGLGAPPGLDRGRGGEEGFGKTERTDAWWLQPLVQGLTLLGLGAYATWAAFQGVHYEWGNYLSPFYSPLLKPSWWPLSPALLVLGAPLGFRGTCYYYRKAYYRAFFADPVACAVGEPRKGYTGESKFPFVLQNLHRYLIYLAIPILFFLWIDIVKGFSFDGRFGIGVGSLILLVSNSLLTLYTFSCHSIRHLVGGRVDCFSCVVAGGPRHKVWQTSSWLNEHHMGWAWWSLFGVCAADLYVRLLSLGVITDWRLL